MTPTHSRDSLVSAIQSEHDAYETMRELVPDLALPLARRRPLTRRQQSAVDDYRHAHERLRLARIDSAVHNDRAIPLPRTG